jgi:uncharacterized protein (TIGR03435 family)
VVLARPAAAQPSPALAFEVASVRPSQSCPLGAFGGRFEQLPGGRVVTTCMPIRELVRVAFGLGRFQEIRGPAVLDQLVDVQATAPDRYETVAALRPVVPALVRTLLVERFKMSARVESTDAPAYLLTLAHPDGRLGPRIRAEHVADCAAARAADQAEYEASGQKAKNEAAVIASIEASRKGSTVDHAALGYKDRPLICAVAMSSGAVRAHSVTLTAVVEMLAPFLERPMIDNTGLAGTYSFELTFTMTDPVFNEKIRSRVDAPDGRPLLREALRDQLGLDLTEGRGPVASVVVDRIEPPAPN